MSINTLPMVRDIQIRHVNLDRDTYNHDIFCTELNIYLRSGSHKSYLNIDNKGYSHFKSRNCISIHIT